MHGSSDSARNKAAEAIHVIVVSAQSLFRELLVHRLTTEPNLRVTALDTPQAGMEAIRTARPDVVLMGTAVPEFNPITAVAQIAAVSPRTRVLLLGDRIRDLQIAQAMRLGVAGYLSMQDTMAGLINAVRRVARGEGYYSPQIRSRLLPETGTHRAKAGRRTRLSTLSKRELEVLTYIASGLANKEIARVMHLSIRTVETHASRLMTKLNMRDRVALTRFAIAEGLVKP